MHENRQARERALELLYEAEAKEVHPATLVAASQVAPVAYAAELAEGVGDHRELLDHVVAPVAYAAELAEGVGDHRELLDHVVGGHARDWTVARMPAIDRALLRLAAFELAFRRDQSDAVVISEAVELAKEFSTDGSARFVNGVLSPVAHDFRSPEGRWSRVHRPPVLMLDVDGVVRHWSQAELEAAELALGLPLGALAVLAFEPDRLHRAMTGALTDEGWLEEVAEAAAAAHGCAAEDVIAQWATITWRLDDDVVALLGEVTAERTALFSNATTRLESDLESVGLDDAVDVVVNSSRIGAAKPAAEAFALAVERVGVEPADCLFVDDRPVNVRGALAAGLPAIVFHGAERLRAVLRRCGFLP